MPNDEVIGPRKTMFVLVIVVGCFAVLWPRILSPLVLGPSREQMQPNQFDREAGCCEVIFETDVAVLELVNEVCSSTLGVGRLSPQSAAECRKAVNDTCGLDIAVFLKRNENVGKTTKMLVETMQNSNSSCLREHFGVPVYNLGPHLAAKAWDIKDTLKQERAAPMRGMGPHPALRERGRAIPPGPPGPPPMPASKPMALPPHIRVRSPLSVYYENEQPPPIPGMRPPLGSPGGPVPAPKSSMGFVMPIYTICIIVFFVYTLSKILFRRTASPYDSVTPDPQFRRRVFRDDSRSSPDKLGKKEADTIVTAISGLVAEVQQQMEASNAQNQQRQDVQDNARPYTNGTILLNSGPVQIVASEYKDGKEKTLEPVNEKEPTSEPKGTEPIKVVKESSPEQDIVPECKEPTVDSKESSEVIKSSPEPLEQKEATHASVVKELSPEPALTNQTEPSPKPIPEMISSYGNAFEESEETKPHVTESVSSPDSNSSSTAPVYSSSELKAVKEFSPEPTSQPTIQTSPEKANIPNESEQITETEQITEPPQIIPESPETIKKTSVESNDSFEHKESSPKPKEPSPELKELYPVPKEHSPVPNEPSPELKESSLEPKDSLVATSETSPVLKEPSPEPKEPVPELKESVSEPEESIPKLKESILEPEKYTPEPTKAFQEPVKSESINESSLELKDSTLDLLDPAKPELENSIPDPDVLESPTELNVETPVHKAPILDSEDSTIEHKAPTHKESTPEPPQEIGTHVERSPESNVDTGLNDTTSQSKEPTPEPKETNETSTHKTEVENAVAEGALLDLDEAIAELDDATSKLQEESAKKDQNGAIAANYDEVDVELMKVFGSGTKDNVDDKTKAIDDFLNNERFTVTKRTTPEHIEEMTGRSFEVLTPTESPAAFKVVGMELTAHAADGGEWPRDLPSSPPAAASPPPARPHEADQVKSIFLETEIPQQSRVLVTQFEEDREPDNSDKPRPAKHAPLVVSGKMTLSLIQDAPRETPERDPESTVDEFTTASAVTQPAAEKGEIESDEEIDEEIEVEEIEEIEEIEEEEEEEVEEEEPPSPVKTAKK